jgi:hypothetical protein
LTIGFFPDFRSDSIVKTDVLSSVTQTWQVLKSALRKAMAAMRREVRLWQWCNLGTQPTPKVKPPQE